MLTSIYFISRVKKAYKCQCGKSYKTAQGLKSHSISQHIVPTPSEARANIPKMPNLVVTASPASRPNNPPLDNIDTTKLVRIYDAIKAKDLPSFTIPKHNLTHLNIIAANQSQSLRHSVLLTPNSSPVSNIDRIKYDRSPKVTVTQEVSYDVTSLSMPSDRRG